LGAFLLEARVTRPFFASLATLAAVALASGGCYYACPVECAARADVIATQGMNPDTGGAGGMDPATVCDRPEINEALTCEDCRVAIEQSYRLLFPKMACDCPRPDEQITYFPEDGEPVQGSAAEVCLAIDLDPNAP
jgi:hypothetical protein